MMGRNILLASMFSIALTFVAAIVYTFYPLIYVLLSRASSSSESGGIGAVAGGVSSLSLFALLVAPVLFLIIFALLQRRSSRR